MGQLPEARMISERLARARQELALAAMTQVEFREGDAEHLDRPAESFDSRAHVRLPEPSRAGCRFPVRGVKNPTPGAVSMDEGPGRRDRLAAAVDAEQATGQIEQLFREHYSLVFRAAYRITGNAGDAEDVLQNVFLRLLRRDPEAEAVADMGSYLYRAAVNVALDLMRSRHKAPSISLDDDQAPVPPLEDSFPGPDRTYTSGEIRDWLRRTVARLTPRAAEIFALRFYEEKANPEIAQILGTTQASVSVTLHRTRTRIEREFRARWGERA